MRKHALCEGEHPVSPSDVLRLLTCSPATEQQVSMEGARFGSQWRQNPPSNDKGFYIVLLLSKPNPNVKSQFDPRHKPVVLSVSSLQTSELSRCPRPSAALYPSKPGSRTFSGCRRSAVQMKDRARRLRRSVRP